MIDKYNTVFYIYLKDINSIFYFIIIFLPTY